MRVAMFTFLFRRFYCKFWLHPAPIAIGAQHIAANRRTAAWFFPRLHKIFSMSILKNKKSLRLNHHLRLKMTLGANFLGNE
jgi:hypothetical protein